MAPASGAKEKSSERPRTVESARHVSYPLEELRRHGGASMCSPAAKNRVATPGPGTHTVGDKDMRLLRPAAAKWSFSKTDRFKHIGPALPGTDTGFPGPDAYDGFNKICLANYQFGHGKRA